MVSDFEVSQALIKIDRAIAPSMFLKCISKWYWSLDDSFIKPDKKTKKNKMDQSSSITLTNLGNSVGANSLMGSYNTDSPAGRKVRAKIKEGKLLALGGLGKADRRCSSAISTMR